MADFEDSFKRIKARVNAIIITDLNGKPLRATIDVPSSISMGGLLAQLALKARHVVRDIDPTNDMQFLRLSYKKQEVMVMPDKNFFLFVLQNKKEEQVE
mmetsp:Transcript_32973/g.57929  ORF Transcript_32973/g.57929 Transcript_32973/m.57929 type:complete len:99 (+) Transcript_32973:868-1164(+)